MPALQPQNLTKEDWQQRLHAIHPKVAIPGFWSTLAENAMHWARELTVGPFWSQAKGRLDQWRMEYRTLTGTDLLTEAGLPDFVSKSAERIEDKLYRSWKKCPMDRQLGNLEKAIAREGPPLPRIGDLVRTRIACCYIDGVEFLAGKLSDLGVEMSLSPERYREGRITGYFAQHITIPLEATYRFGGASELTKVRCEIQVASELATRMWVSAHPLYETDRGQESDPTDWQWNPDDPRFISNQLGHMIHLADGLLVQLLRKTNKSKDE
jgi:hypothetical protein